MEDFCRQEQSSPSVIYDQSKAPESLLGLQLPKEIMKNCKLLPNRDEALALVSVAGGVIAEIGVAYGDFSKTILDTLSPNKFYAIDVYGGSSISEFFGMDFFSKSGKGHKDFIEEKFKNEIAKGQFMVKSGLSWDVLLTFDDNFFNFIYLDAGHDYESVKKDIAVILRKIKNGGIIQFNDYIIYSWSEGVPYGVVRAVDELLVNGKHEVLFFVCIEAVIMILL